MGRRAVGHPPSYRIHFLQELGNGSGPRATTGGMLSRLTPRRVGVLPLSALGLLAVACAHRPSSPNPERSTGTASDEPPTFFSDAKADALETIAVKVADLQGRSLDAPPLEPKRPIGPLSYSEAVRMRDWAAALRLLDATPPAEQKRPELRYLRGRLSLELGNPEAALRALENLDTEAPSFADEVTRLRAEAHFAAGQVDEVVAYFGAQSDLNSWLVAIRALVQAERWEEARERADKAVAAAMKQRSRSRRAEARALRARIAEAQGHRKQAIVDYRWLALEAPTEPAAQGAPEAVRRLDEKQRLTKQQRLQRAQALASEGRLDETERELEALEAAPGPKPQEAETLAVRAEALYRSRKDYARAAELFGRAAKLSPVRREQHLFFEANSLSRAHRDQEAIAKYESLIKLYPRGTWLDSALYNVARLRFIDGQWKKAVDSYGDYLRRRGKNGRNAPHARYELAVARLAAGQFAQAEVELGLLRSKEKSTAVASRLLELEGVAQQEQGKRAAAIATFQRVITERPLSFEALVAAARLRQMGASEPPYIAPAPADAGLPPLEVTLPDKVRRLHDIGLDAEAEEELRRHEAELRRQYGDRSGEALCLAYGQLRSARRRYQVAQFAVNWQTLAAAPGPSTAWQWECVYPQPYEKIVASAEAERELPRHLIYAVMRQESAFAATVVSPAGAVGLMQIIEPTARNIAEELAESYEAALMRAPAINVRFGAYYLRKLLDMFGGQVYLAAAAYNAGPHAASRWLHAGETLPLDVFVARIPYRETRGYVYQVMGNWARYNYLAGGPEAVPRVDLKIPAGLRASVDAY